jgi:ComF family protein
VSKTLWQLVPMEEWQKYVKSAAGRVINLVLPPRCAVSGEEVERQGMLSSGVWAGLDFIADPFCECCGLPFDFDTGTGGALCASCIQERPEYTKARAALKYNDTSRDLILGFKHGDQLHAVLAFMPWLKAAGQEFLGMSDYLVPVPLHRTRLLARRYNQAAIIAQRLGRETGIDVLAAGLERTRNTQTQGHLKSRERLKNVKRAFRVNPKLENVLKGKTVTLIDDVYTTGATVRECTKALRKGGVAQVYVLSIARVVRE